MFASAFLAENSKKHPWGDDAYPLVFLNIEQVPISTHDVVSPSLRRLSFPGFPRFVLRFVGRDAVLESGHLFWGPSRKPTSLSELPFARSHIVWWNEFENS